MIQKYICKCYCCEKSRYACSKKNHWKDKPETIKMLLLIGNRLGKGEEGHGRDFLKYTFFDHFGLVNVF
jgi:hypothetical protein